MNLHNPMNNWYTDLVDIYRVEEYTDSYITKHRLTLMRSKVPCRVYKNPVTFTQLTPQQSEIMNNDKLACNTDVDIIAGDKLVVTRGGRLGHNSDIKVYIAGDPVEYYEPFGGIRPRIDHKEVPLGGMIKLDTKNLDDDINKVIGV